MIIGSDPESIPEQAEELEREELYELIDNDNLRDLMEEEDEN